MKFDKIIHIFIGGLIYIIASLVLPSVFAILIVTLAALARELTGKKFDVWDMWATIAGGIIALLILNS